MPERVVAVVQARMGSLRLPNKMMLWLHGLPVVGWVLHRVRQAKKIDKVVFALPDLATDDVLSTYLQSQGASVFRGDERDVLGRILAAARANCADWVVRICADNPLVAGSEIDRLIEFFCTSSFDYAYNHLPRNNRYPDGLGAEITNIKLLARLGQEASLPDQREHIFNYLWENTNHFRIGTCDPTDPEIAYPYLKFDLDTWSDYERLLCLDLSPDSSAREVVEAALSVLEKTA